MSTPLVAPFLVVQIDFRRKFQVNALQGILEEAERRRCPYDIVSLDQKSPISDGWSNCWGVISFIGRESHRDNLAKLPYPVINLSNAMGPLRQFGNLLSDDFALGRLAARHLIERGRRVLFGLGLADKVFSHDRLEGFIAEAKKEGVEVFLQDQPDMEAEMEDPAWSPRKESLAAAKQLNSFMANLPPEVGLFGVNDHLAQLMMICLHHSFPERLHTSAVLGVDNDFLYHRLPGESLSLSSMRTAFRKIGAAALSWFVDHPEGDKEEVGKLLKRFPPEGVNARASTSGAPCDHPIIARGLRWAWEQLRWGNPPTVRALAEELRMSTRTLERLCQKQIGQTARDYLLELRLDRAKQLLREEPTMSLAQVGEVCGFSKPTHFSFAFRQANGQSPRDYRQQFT